MCFFFFKELKKKTSSQKFSHREFFLITWHMQDKAKVGLQLFPWKNNTIINK